MERISFATRKYLYNLLYYRLYWEIFGNDDRDYTALVFALSYFSGRSSMTVDLLARAVIDHLQIKVRMQHASDSLIARLRDRFSQFSKSYSFDIQCEAD